MKKNNASTGKSSSPNRNKPSATSRSTSARSSSSNPLSKSKVSSHMHAEQARTGDRIAVTIKRLGINGEGVGYYKRKAVFIPGALPEEIVKADITHVEPSYLKASLVQIERKSPHRIKPACPVYEQCGGCQLLHMNAAGQLAAKQELVREAFARYMGDTAIPIRATAGMQKPWAYRNKAQLQMSYHNEKILTGLYTPSTHHVVDISGCPIQHPAINEAVQQIKKIAEQLQMPIYDERRNTGILRTVVVRTGFRTDDLQITFVTAKPQLPRKEQFVQQIVKAVPKASTIAQNINSSTTPQIFGEETKILWGKEQITEQLGDFTFSLSPRAFFQLNPVQTQVLYDYAKEAAGLTGKETVVDAYCGTGTIALWLAAKAKEIRGIESIPEAVEDARFNAKLNHVDNVNFTVGKAEELLPKWVKSGFTPDVIVVDPPRTGCDDKLLQAITTVKPRRMVYVSCNPSTLAKDCKYLTDHGYKVEWVQPVDMFPQTAHVESVILMVKK